MALILRLFHLGAERMSDKGTRRPRRRGMTRLARPFDHVDAAHTVVRVAERLGWNFTDPRKFLRQVQHVEFGLAAEVEFAAILRWLGTCCLVHRLSEDAFFDKTDPEWGIPDLLAVFRSDGKTCTTLVEVKSTDEMELTFHRDYLDRLNAYAAVVGLPLLIAWRPRRLGWWLLVDAAVAQADRGESYRLDLGTAAKNDLMSLLAGDYLITPMAGCGLRFEAQRIGEKQETPDGYQVVFQIQKAYFHDATGQETDLPEALSWLILSMAEPREEVNEDSFVQSFVVALEGTTGAQTVLRVAVGFQIDKAERIHWKEVGENLDQILRNADLLRECQARFGTYVRYVFYQQPQVMPAFLPAAWRSSGRPFRQD